jgi:hypothetical protein
MISDAVIRLYDEAGKVIETHEHAKCVRIALNEDGRRRAPTPTNQKVACLNHAGRTENPRP